MPDIILSHAQALEDIHLYRALRDVQPEVGFYIDVGANDPHVDSVTRLFYDMGWRGINIDASPIYAEKLRENRPRDFTIEAAVSDAAGSLIFYDDGGGLSTTVEEIAESHKVERGIAMKERVVQTVALSDICAAHAPEHIHFLKVDVEGAEASALRSMDFDRFRPWLLCIESHYPLRPDVQVYEDWEPSLLGKGYEFCFTDTINRYYVAREHAERASSFSSPACYYVHANVARRMQDLENRIKVYETCIGGIKKIVQTI